MLYFRMFSDYIYTQNPMGLQAQIRRFPFAVIKYFNIFKDTTFDFLPGHTTQSHWPENSINGM